MSQRERLIARVRHIRIAAAASDREPVSDPAQASAASPLYELEARVAHLEQQLRGLQDSVHRENVRHTAKLADLAARVEPAALAVALDRDARERGL
jgi:ABC-type phosphate transport system auxiliary subunit